MEPPHRVQLEDDLHRGVLVLPSDPSGGCNESNGYDHSFGTERKRGVGNFSWPFGRRVRAPIGAFKGLAFAPGRIESRTRGSGGGDYCRRKILRSPSLHHSATNAASRLTPSGSFSVPLRAEFQSFWLCRGVAGHFFSLPRKGRKIGKQCLSSPSLTFFGTRS